MFLTNINITLNLFLYCPKTKKPLFELPISTSNMSVVNAHVQIKWAILQLKMAYILIHTHKLER